VQLQVWPRLCKKSTLINMWSFLTILVLYLHHVNDVFKNEESFSLLECHLSLTHCMLKCHQLHHLPRTSTLLRYYMISTLVFHALSLSFNFFQHCLVFMLTRLWPTPSYASVSSLCIGNVLVDGEVIGFLK
jgi:hypothetical protein